MSAPAPMRFLARLAPAARDAGGAVRAALPSRFAPAGEAPELQVQTPAPAEAPKASDAQVRSSAPRAEHGATAVKVETTQVTQRVAKPSVTAVPDTVRPRRPDAETPAARIASALASGHAVAAAPAEPMRGNVEGLSPEARPPRREAEAPLRPIVMPPATMARPSVEIKPPLRGSTVAQRAAATRSDAPAVVHVTIDRLDVRTPGPAAPSRPNPKPRAASSLSLNEYLHQRDRSRNGGHR